VGKHIPGAKALVEPEAVVPGLKSRPISEATLSAASEARCYSEPSVAQRKSKYGGSSPFATLRVRMTTLGGGEVSNPMVDAIRLRRTLR
jgi:hypothetical protein